MPPKKIGMQKQEFVIVMKPSKQSVILETEKVLSASPLTRKANALRLSLGIFGLIGQQTSAILGQDLGIGIGALVYRLDWSRWIKERWKFEIHLSSDSGSGNTFQGDEITLSSSDFVRQEYQFKGIHFPQLWKYKLLKKYDSEWGYFLGVNYQTFPYLNRQAGESSTVTAQLKTNAVTTVFTGLQYMVDINSKWSSEFQMLYYHPLSVTGGVTSLESSMMLGFVGDVSYSISPRFKVGGRFGYYLDQQTSSYYDEVSADSASIVEVRNRTDASIFGTWLF
jgi:hypothetical protein